MGVGFAKDAESRAKQNASLRNRLKDKYFKKQKYDVKKSDSIHFKEASQTELEAIRTKLSAQKNKLKYSPILF